MSSLLTHILRTLAPHAERFADLREVTVPSAAISDEQTAQWSADLYARDMEQDRRDRGIYRTLALVVCGWLLAASVLAAPTARADVNVCSALHNSPTVGTVEELALGFIADGWTATEAGEMIARSVVGGCPQYTEVLRRFIAAYSPTQPT